MRIDEGESFTVAQVLNRHVLQQGGLAHAGLADDIHVAIAVLRLDAERDIFPARISRREIGDALWIFHHVLV